MTDKDVSSFPIVLCFGEFLELLLLLYQDQFPYLDPQAYSSGHDKSRCYTSYKNYILESSFSLLFLFGAEVARVDKNS